MSSTLPYSFPPSDASAPRPGTGLADGHSTSGPADGGGTHSGQELLGRVVHGAHDTLDRMADTAAPHVQRLQDSVTSAADAVQSGAGKLRATGGEWTEGLRCTVRANPLAAVGVALVAGLLVARLTGR